jgi:hypothetical protein
MEGRRGGGVLQAQSLRDDALDPDKAILTPAPISLTIARDGLWSSTASRMQASASLCGATTCRDRSSTPGRGYRAFSAPSGLSYARYCKRTSENTPSPKMGE